MTGGGRTRASALAEAMRQTRATGRADASEHAEADLPRMRARMIEALAEDDFVSPDVLRAMSAVPRHRFVPLPLRARAYAPTATLPIGFGQTISQPLTVARMTSALGLHPASRVLEIGTGSGYQAAVLAHLAVEVHTVERLPELAHRAATLLAALGLPNVCCALADGTLGAPAHAPFDAILVSAGGPSVPEALLEQLADRGRLVIPVGERQSQRVVRVTRVADRFLEEDLGDACFVDLVGDAGWSVAPRSRDMAA